MGRLEDIFRDSIVKPSRYAGFRVLVCHGHAFQGRGWPDLFIASPQWRGWLELKVKSPLEPHQAQMVADLRNWRVPCYVLRENVKVGGVAILDDQERELGFFQDWDKSCGMAVAVAQVQALFSMLADTDPWYYTQVSKKLPNGASHPTDKEWIKITREMGLRT